MLAFLWLIVVLFEWLNIKYVKKYVFKVSESQALMFLEDKEFRSQSSKVTHINSFTLIRHFRMSSTKRKLYKYFLKRTQKMKIFKICISSMFYAKSIFSSSKIERAINLHLQFQPPSLFLLLEYVEYI